MIVWCFTFPYNPISSLRVVSESGSFLRKESGRVREAPRRKRSLKNLGLEFECEAETNTANAAMLQRRIGKAGPLLLQTRVIDEWINASLTDDAAEVGWLKTFVMVVWKVTFNLSFTLKSL